MNSASGGASTEEEVEGDAAEEAAGLHRPQPGGEPNFLISDIVYYLTNS